MSEFKKQEIMQTLKRTGLVLLDQARQVLWVRFRFQSMQQSGPHVSYFKNDRFCL